TGCAWTPTSAEPCSPAAPRSGPRSPRRSPGRTGTPNFATPRRPTVSATSWPTGRDVPERVLAIVGPTATGKSDLAIALAQRLGGEVVNADSMQLYAGMDIGTAKLPVAERGGVP